MTKTKSKPLGRGLGNLLGADSSATDGHSLLDLALSPPAIDKLPIELIQPNQEQPRKDFDEERLEELSASIRSLGLIQPITVEPLAQGKYQIISGERRWRAAQRAGLTTLPVYIRPIQTNERQELALIENIQREDLNAIEIALAYQQILQSQQITQEELSKRVGKKRATIANYLRLLKLPAEVQLGLTSRQIEMTHARALLQVEDPERQIELYQLILSEHLTARAVEELARAIAQEANTPSSPPSPSASAPAKAKRTERKEFALLEEHLSQLFASKVSLKCSVAGKGKLTIPFTSEKELEHILLLLERLQHSA